MTWHTTVLRQLRDSGLFVDVQLVGGKVRATLDTVRFLDIHYDPTTHSYSYAFLDLALPYPGDKRVFGWDDFPHPGDAKLKLLPSHPHHFQERLPNGQWRFDASPCRGEIEIEVIAVLDYLRQYLESSLK